MNDRFITCIDFIIFGSDKWRINISKNSHGDPRIIYDAHGQTVREAKRNIENIVNVTRSPLHLEVIHGYNHGTAIKDMLALEVFPGRLAEKFCPQGNPGVTVMEFLAA
jgi:hypothetical protein